MQVSINVDEGSLGHVSQGQSVSMQVPAYPDQTFTGTVTTIAPGVDQKTRTATVLIQPQDDSGQLKPGMMAQVSIITGSQSNVLLVPTQAVLGTPAPNSAATVVTLDGNVAHHTTVQLGLVNPSVVQVSGGLSEGQVVAVGNTGGLNNGDVVAPQMQTQTALASNGVQ
jgi:RND family efflux transporter MFP subunit